MKYTEAEAEQRIAYLERQLKASRAVVRSLAQALKTAEEQLQVMADQIHNARVDALQGVASYIKREIHGE